MDRTHLIFDRALYIERLRRARTSGRDILARSVAEELGERLSFITRSFEYICIIAPAPGPVAEALQTSGKVRRMDLRETGSDDDLHLQPQHYDAIFHILDLHAVNDVPGQLSQMRRAL